MTNKDLFNVTHRSLAKAFAAVVEHYLDNCGGHVHAALALTCDDVASNGPVNHFAYVEHTDHQRQILATFMPLDVQGHLEWKTILADVNIPTYLSHQFKARGFGPKRYTEDEAVEAFREHAKKHHPACEVSFTGTSPGRVVVRLLSVINGITVWNRPYGIILDARVIRGERVFKVDDASDTALYGIDIHG